jgi:hypothetical protein
MDLPGSGPDETVPAAIGVAATRRDDYGMALPNPGKPSWLGDNGRADGIELLTLRILTVIFAPVTERTF